MLTGDEIRRQVGLGGIVIEPFDESRLNPNSYNLRLSPQLRVYRKAMVVHERWDAVYRSREETNRTRRGYGSTELPVTAWDAPSLLLEEPLDMAVEEETVKLEICPREGLRLYPGVLYLGCTEEYTETRDFVPTIEGRSSVARLGMQVHLTAGFGDVGFQGDWTLEITVVHPLVVRTCEVCQIAYAVPCGAIRPYRGRYQGQRGPKPSGLWKDFQKEAGK